MEHLGDEAQVVAPFSPFGDDVIFLQDVPQAQKSFWTHPMVLLGDEAQVVAHFGPFGDSVILMQDRCTVCTEDTIVSEIILHAHNGTSR